MRILQICSYYTDSPLYQNLFDALENKGIEEDIYVFTEKNYLQKADLPKNVILSRSFSNFDRYIFHLKHFKVLKDIKKKLNLKEYNLIHAHSLFSNGYIAYKIFKKYNIPYVVTVRNTDVNIFFKKLFYLRNTGRVILLNAKKIIFLSEPYKKTVIENYIPLKFKDEIENKSSVINNGIDKFWLENKYLERKSPKENEINFVFAGKINKNKNIETTVETCNILIKKGYKVSLKLIGKIYDESYNDLIISTNYIEHIPFCIKEELITHYRNSDIFIMPSKTESFGLVYAEAMTQGLPIIYTKGEGFDGNFEDGAVGYAVPANDSEYISQRVLKILTDYQDISERCLEHCKIFDWDKLAKILSSGYLSYITNKNSDL